jgi:glycine betaine catabolism B
LTIASSPTEPDIMVAVKHPTPASAFKQRLNGLKPGEPILGAHLAGQFTLPEKPTDKLAFLAGGVGITPFRSMIRYLTDKGQNTDAVLIYSVTKKEEAAFSNVFSQARSRGIKPYLLAGEKISPEKIRSFMPDFLDRKIYVSGPYGFVKAAEEALLNLGAKPGNIVTDYFPGYGG